MNKLSTTLLLGIFFTVCLNSCTQGSKVTESLPDEQDSTHTVTLKAVDYAFSMPATIPSGWITFEMENMGNEEHVAVVEKMVDTLRLEQMAKMTSEAMETGKFNKIFSFSTSLELGGPGLLSPDKNGETTVYLEPGPYLLLCGVKTPEGDYHYQKGMIKAFMVTDTDSKTEKPDHEVNITLSNYSIETDKGISAGKQTFNVIFNDGDKHDIHLTKLKKGQTVEDLLQWMDDVKAPSEFLFLGGAEQVPEGQESTFTADLQPGRYAFVCHYAAGLGMAEEFIVPESGQSPPLKFNAKNKVILSFPLEQPIEPIRINSGKTNLQISANQDSVMFSIFMMKEDQGKNEVISFYEDIVFLGKYKPGKTEYPWRFVSDVIPMAQNVTEDININLKPGKYVVMGPVPLNKGFRKAWTRDLFREIIVE